MFLWKHGGSLVKAIFQILKDFVMFCKCILLGGNFCLLYSHKIAHYYRGGILVDKVGLTLLFSILLNSMYITPYYQHDFVPPRCLVRKHSPLLEINTSIYFCLEITLSHQIHRETIHYQVKPWIDLLSITNNNNHPT